jgi:hypothetical protein
MNGLFDVYLLSVSSTACSIASDENTGVCLLEHVFRELGVVD